MLDDTPQWVAVYTRARAEKRVESRLREVGFECYLPLRKERHQWKDRKKEVEVPLLRSYVFVKICKKDVVPVRSVDGVAWIVSFGNVIQPIPEWQIDAMRMFLAANIRLTVKRDAALHRGAKVRILSGLFEGMRGELLSDCKEGNFGVKVEALNVMLIVDMDKDMLEPLLGEELVERKGKFEKRKI